MSEVSQKGAAAKAASVQLAMASAEKKNEALLAMANALAENQSEIFAANAVDLEKLTQKDNYSKAYYDRLALSTQRITAM
ncbi:MAG: gamma-glutamyl-phosphate reductase, partial [Firmicutes bacterium]|nr:gamma-glutamyl-phosphate reductase [Bacillota bacterium]